MADEEVSSLLLKVGVDFAALEEFVAAMPVVVDVAAAVGDQLNAMEIGNPDAFRDKGQALARAMAAGFQAEALGLQFGGSDIASIITERVFGQLDTSSAISYVTDVQRVLDGVKLQLPGVTQPVFNTDAFRSITAGAEGARALVGGLTQQLGILRAELATLQGLSLPKTLVRKGLANTVELAPAARKALESVGITPPQPTPAFRDTGARGFGERALNVAETNRNTEAYLNQLLQGRRGVLEQAVANTSRVATAVQAVPVRAALPPAADQGALRRQEEERARQRAFTEEQIRREDREDEAVARQQRAARQARIQRAGERLASTSFGEAAASPLGIERGNRPSFTSQRRIFPSISNLPQGRDNVEIVGSERLQAQGVAGFANPNGRGGGRITLQQRYLDALNRAEAAGIPDADLARFDPIAAAGRKTLVHETAHLTPRRNVPHFLQRYSNDDNYLAREEARAQALSGQRGYGPRKNATTGQIETEYRVFNPQQIQEFERVHARITEGIARREHGLFLQREREQAAIRRGPFNELFPPDPLGQRPSPFGPTGPLPTNLGRLLSREEQSAVTYGASHSGSGVYSGTRLREDRAREIEKLFRETQTATPVLTQDPIRAAQRALPVGTGRGPVDFTADARAERILDRFDGITYGPNADLRALPFTPASLVRGPIAPPFDIERLSDDELRRLAALKAGPDPMPRGSAPGRKIYDQPDEYQSQRDRFGNQSGLQRMNERVMTRNRQREAERDNRQAQIDFDNLPLPNQAANILSRRESSRGFMQTARETQARYEAAQAAAARRASLTALQEGLRASRGTLDERLAARASYQERIAPRPAGPAPDFAAAARVLENLGRGVPFGTTTTPFGPDPLREVPRLTRGAPQGGPVIPEGVGPQERIARQLIAKGVDRQGVIDGLDNLGFGQTASLVDSLLPKAPPVAPTTPATSALNKVRAEAEDARRAARELLRAGASFDEALGALRKPVRDGGQASTAAQARVAVDRAVADLARPSLADLDRALPRAIPNALPLPAVARPSTPAPAPVVPSAIPLGPRTGLVPTISDAENDLRRRRLQVEAERQARQRAADARRERFELFGSPGTDQPRGTRPGTSQGPQPEGAADRYRRLREDFDRRRAAAGFPSEADVGFNGPRSPGGPGGRGPGGPGGPAGAGAGGGPFGIGPLGSFLGGVRRGALGDGTDTPDFLGRSIGSALRFSLVYGAAYSALRLFTGGFREGVQGAIEFEQALTDLNIATERTGRSNEAFAFSLANQGAGLGLAPGEAVSAGARAVGLFGATESSKSAQEAIAKTSLDVAGKIAFLNPGQSLEQVQTQLAGITRSFNIDPADQSRVFDIASFIGRRSGRPAGELLQSLGQIGSLGGDAGFSAEQTAAIIGQLTSTTGQTPQAVSGFLSQVLSRADDPRLQAKLRSVGVDTQGTTLAQQIEQLSGLDLPQDQKNQIVAGFGRGRSGQALGIILEQFPQIQALANGAAGAAGIGDKDFAQASNTVGSQLRILGSSLRDLATGLASTGILDVFVLLLEGAQAVVDVLDGFVDIINLIPREVRTAVFALGTLVAALALITKVGRIAAVTGVATTAPLAARAGGAAAALFGASALGGRFAAAAAGGFDANGRPVGVPFGPLTPAAAALTPVTGAGALAGVLAGLGGSRVGQFLAPAANVLASRLPGVAVPAAGLAGAGLGAGVLGVGAIAAAAVLAGIGIFKAVGEASQVGDRLRDSGSAIFEANDTDSVNVARRRIAESRRAAEEREDFKLLSSDSFTFGLVNIFDDLRGAITGGGSKQQIADAREQEEVLKRREEAVKKTREEAIDKSPSAAFDGFAAGAESVARGLEDLTARGFNATERLQALNDAFDVLVTKSTAGADAVGVIFAGQFDQFALDSTTSLSKSGNKFARGLSRDANNLNEFESGGLRSQIFGGGANFLKGLGRDLISPVVGLAAGASSFQTDQSFSQAAQEAIEGDRFKTVGNARTGFRDVVTGRGASATGALVGAFNEFNPFKDNDRERAAKIREGGEEIRRVLGDEAVQAQLGESAADVLRERGKDPALGTVVLTKEDKDAILQRRKEILEDNLGLAFDQMPKAVRDAFYEDAEQDFSEFLKGFGGNELSGDNIASFLEGQRQEAPAAGERERLRTGDAQAGALVTLQQFQSRRDDIVARIAEETDPGEKANLERGLSNLDDDIARAYEAYLSPRNARIDALAGRDRALTDDPIQQARISLAAIAEKLDGEVNVDTRLALEAEQATTVRTLRRSTATRANAAQSAGVDPRDGLGNAQARLDSSRRLLAVETPGTEAYYNALAQVRQAQKALADAELEGAVAALFVNVNPQDTVGQARAALEETRLKRAALRKPLGAVSGLADFDTQGNPTGTVDVVQKGEGIGQQVITGLLKPNYTAAGATAADQLVAGFKGSVAAAAGLFSGAQTGTGVTNPAAPGYVPAPRTPNQTNFADAAGRVTTATAAVANANQRLETAQRRDASPQAIAAIQRDLVKAQEQLAQAKKDLAAAGAASAVSTGARNVNRPNLGNLATSGALAPRPGQLVGGSNALIDFLLGSGAGFARADGSVVPRRTADGGVSDHSFGNAIDIFGSEAELDNITSILKPLVGKGLDELLFTGTSGPGTYLGKNGAFKPSANVVKNHRDHIHAVVDDPSLLGGAAATAGAGPSSLTPAERKAEDDRLRAEEAQRLQALRQEQADFDISKLQANTNPNNSLEQARNGLRAANRNLRAQVLGTKAFYDAITQVRSAQQQLADAERDRASSKDLALAAGQGPLTQAKTRLHVATRNLRSEVKGTQEYYDALAAQREAQVALADAIRQADGNRLRLGSDLTDPTAQLAIDLRVARRRQRENIARGADRETRDQDSLDVKSLENQLAQSKFDKDLNRQKTDTELGRQSQGALVTFLTGQRDRLLAIKNRSEQEQQQLDTVERELKGLNTQLSGQFNLGDIDVPTPFEVRRQIAEQSLTAGQDAVSQINSRAYGGGDSILQQATAGFAPSTDLNLGGASAASQYVTITVNGGDINQVKNVMAQYLGQQAFQRTTISNTKV